MASSSRLVVVRESLPMLMSRIRARTPASRGKVRGPAERLRRDEVGEKLNRILKQSIVIRRETGRESGPFQIKDWMK
jgi:hypothetical protein